MHGSDADYAFSITRGDRVLMADANGITVDGLEVATAETPCLTSFDECALRLGVQGVSPDGEPVVEFTRQPVVVAVGEHSMLVTASGERVLECPDGTDPDYAYSEMNFSAIDTEFIVRR